MGALKIAFGFRGGALRMQAVQATGQRPPPANPIAASATGFWLDIYDSRSRGTYSQILTDPRTGGGVDPRGVVLDRDYVAVVPDPGRGGFVVFHVPSGAPETPAVARFPLKTSEGPIGFAVRWLKKIAPKKRVWLAVLSDGFAPDQAPRFDHFADAFIDALCACRPFDEFPGLKDSIAKVTGPATSGGDFGWKITELANRPLIQVDAKRVATFIQGLAVDPLNVLVVVNLDRYGGSGGDPAVTGLGAFTDGVQAQWDLDIAVNAALHELGHSAFALADEYSTAGAGASTAPVELNVAGDVAGVQSKWGDLLTGGPLPSRPNQNDQEVDDGDPEALAVVGMFEGAKWDPSRNYRSQLRCKMRRVDFEFCAACRSVINATLAAQL